jgi:hypothetical protein
LPLPPPPAPPPPAPPSKTSQPNITKNAAPESQELNNTLEKLRALQQQQKPPTARANPSTSSGPVGATKGDITGSLTDIQRGAIGDRVRECWTKDPGALDLDKMSVQVTVTTDATGTVRQVVVADVDRAAVSANPPAAPCSMFAVPRCPCRATSSAATKP